MSPLVLSSPGELRRHLLRLQQNHSARLAPDGLQFAYLKTAGSASELWLRRGGQDRRLASFAGGTVSDPRWTADSKTVVYRHAEHGREEWRLMATRVRDLGQVRVQETPLAGDYWLSPSDAVVVYAAREKGATRPGLFRLDLTRPSEAPVLLAANPGFHRWLVDSQLRPRGGVRFSADGSADVVLGEDLGSARVVLRVIPDSLADFSVLRFSPDGSRLFVLSSTGGASRRLLALSPDGAVTTVFEHPALDIESYPAAPDAVWFNPVTGEPDMCTVMDQRLRYHFLEKVTPQVAGYLSPERGHSHVIIDRSADDLTWLMAQVRDNNPMRLYLYYPATGQSGPALLNRPELAGARLPSLQDFCFDASDGRRISGYALQPQHGTTPFPTVVLIHGGPAGRDTWRFHAEAQYLASLGFLSLHINYRGSRGFGTEFRQAGNGEWGGLMQQDLYDAISHGVALGLVDPRRVSFMGSSYGGFAALLAACTRPDLARCAVAVSPPCDLVSFASTPPRYWSALAGQLLRQLTLRADGHHLGGADLASRSPAHLLSPSCAPLLIAHGARDPRVPVADVEAFVQRARNAGVAVRYLSFPDEGHLVKSNRNRETLFAEIQTFLEPYSASGR